MKRTLVDMDAEVSGTDSGDEASGCEEETEADRSFIDDGPLEEAAAASPDRARIRRSERLLSVDDHMLVLENAGMRGAHRRAERGGGSATVYKDSDEEGARSSDEDFVVSDSDEEVGRKATKIVRDYVRSQGLITGSKRQGRVSSARAAPAAIGSAASAAVTDAAAWKAFAVPSSWASVAADGDLEDSELLCHDDRAPPPPPPTNAPGAGNRLLEPKLAPVFKLCQPRGGAATGGRASGPGAGGTVSQPRVHPTPPVRQPAAIFIPKGGVGGGKVAAIFAPEGRAAADRVSARWPGKRGLVPAPKRPRAASGAAAGGGKAQREQVTNTVVLDRATGQAYFVHEDGRRSPRQI